MPKLWIGFWKGVSEFESVEELLPELELELLLLFCRCLLELRPLLLRGGVVEGECPRRRFRLAGLADDERSLVRVSREDLCLEFVARCPSELEDDELRARCPLLGVACDCISGTSLVDWEALVISSSCCCSC